jgi:mannose/cellobiose epimerase-like protein (N-acyl-D-glucosamine 2-epimerase family)
MRALHALRTRLVEWLVTAAYPLWSCNGIDSRTGGFTEALDPRGQALARPRRARVQPRQVYAFAQAPAFGWRGDSSGIVNRGMAYFSRYYQRRDGLFRTLADCDGLALDERALLYDQAFALLGYAAAATLGMGGEFEARALDLRRAIERHMGAADGSFCSGAESSDLRESNPHMHLLEAHLAWAQIGRDPGWASGIRRIVDLALSRFIRADSGVLGESYLANWQPAPGIAGRVIEPGHQFEWAWLLLRCERWYAVPLREAALRLIDIGERFGLCNGVAINAIHDDFTVKDANARLWPQCERLKAALLAATLTAAPRYWSMAEAAALSLLPYLDTAVPGLWRDLQLANGEVPESAAEASTFYHLVGAIVALDLALREGGRECP